MLLPTEGQAAAAAAAVVVASTAVSGMGRASRRPRASSAKAPSRLATLWSRRAAYLAYPCPADTCRCCFQVQWQSRPTVMTTNAERKAPCEERVASAVGPAVLLRIPPSWWASPRLDAVAAAGDRRHRQSASHRSRGRLPWTRSQASAPSLQKRVGRPTPSWVGPRALAPRRLTSQVTASRAPRLLRAGTAHSRSPAGAAARRLSLWAWPCMPAVDHPAAAVGSWGLAATLTRRRHGWRQRARLGPAGGVPRGAAAVLPATLTRHHLLGLTAAPSPATFAVAAACSGSRLCTSCPADTACTCANCCRPRRARGGRAAPVVASLGRWRGFPRAPPRLPRRARDRRPTPKARQR